ncbi:ferritin-like domain-containing protein [Luteirhabdus pelagi]|uniref:ferritin-like domain-containing protein n=1 Tax=Luteirhabdus pelagi TaxID=2792783 RepID=UPI00193A61CA|nr:PA2169 family four-helix-bundle protein [Luteirhabdus pelagi]
MKTTQEKAKEKVHKDLVNNLQELLEKNYDAEKGFKKAMEDADSQRLKEYLKYKSAQHSQFATELTDEIRQLDEQPKEKGSTTGDLHRTWIDIKTAFTGNDDEAVLEECIRGEKASLEEYQERLGKHNFPPKIAETLTKQKSEIERTVSKVKSLEDLADDWN